MNCILKYIYVLFLYQCRGAIYIKKKENNELEILVMVFCKLFFYNNWKVKLKKRLKNIDDIKSELACYKMVTFNVFYLHNNAIVDTEVSTDFRITEYLVENYEGLNENQIFWQLAYSEDKKGVLCIIRKDVIASDLELLTNSFLINKTYLIKDAINNENKIRRLSKESKESLDNEQLNILKHIAFNDYVDNVYVDNINNNKYKPEKHFLYQKLAVVLIGFIVLMKVCVELVEQERGRLGAELIHLETKNKDQIMKRDSLNKVVELHNNLFDKDLQGIRVSFYIDRIMKAKPRQIKVKDFWVMPVNIEQGNELQVLANKIIIKGNTELDVYTKTWIDKMKQFEWVNKVEIKSYSRKSNSVMANFELELEIKHV